jgi:3D (Asp-Asp-Asp) domain-containing protein
MPKQENVFIAVAITGVIALSVMLATTVHECEEMAHKVEEQATEIKQLNDDNKEIAVAYSKSLADNEIALNKLYNARNKYKKSKAKNKKLESQINILERQVKSLRAKQSKESASKKVSPQSNNTAGWHKVTGQITAYSPHDNQSGQEAEGNGNITSIGVAPGYGRFAVDPRRIPYNSKIKIVYSDGSIEEGIAADTGGALRNAPGVVIDVYRDTFAQATAFGRRNATIYWK